MYTQAIIFSIVSLLLLFVYFPWVFLNLTFTFTELPPSKIPWYLGNALPRYGFDWCLLALDMTLLIPPFIAIYITGVPFHGKYSVVGNQSFFQYTTYIIATFEIIKALMYILVYAWIWPSASVIDDNWVVDSPTTSKNYIFWIMFGTSLFFSIWYFVWGSLLTSLMPEYFGACDQKLGKAALAKSANVNTNTSTSTSTTKNINSSSSNNNTTKVNKKKY